MPSDFHTYSQPGGFEFRLFKILRPLGLFIQL